MRGSITLERGWCHDHNVGTDYFFFCYLLLPTIVPFASHPLVPVVDFLLFYSYTLTRTVRY